MTKHSYDLGYSFDTNLREILKSPDEATMACQALSQSLMSEPDPYERAKILGKIGVLQRMLGSLTKAEESLSRSLKLLESIDALRPRIVAAQIRLAHVYQWQGRFAEADGLFHTAAKEATEFDDEGLMRSFALQHLGKSLFDQSKYDEAIKCFYDAMMTRVRLKRDDLADSSRFALNRTIEKSTPAATPDESNKIPTDK